MNMVMEIHHQNFKTEKDKLFKHGGLLIANLIPNGGESRDYTVHQQWSLFYDISSTHVNSSMHWTFY